MDIWLEHRAIVLSERNSFLFLSDFFLMDHSNTVLVYVGLLCLVKGYRSNFYGNLHCATELSE